VYNASSQICECKTGYLSYKVNGVTKCFAPCQDGLTFNYKLENCTCLSNQFDSKGACVNCQDDLAEWNPSANKCECVKGAYSFIGGKCLMCSPNSRYDPVLKICQCLEGYAGSGIVCRKAPTELSPGYTIVFALQPPGK
jgi:hypothetical protein